MYIDLQPRATLSDCGRESIGYIPESFRPNEPSELNTTYVYPPGKVRPVVNAVAARNPAACVAEINVGRCRAFIITPK